jgi:effector-binding domain-containing protein
MDTCEAYCFTPNGVSNNKLGNITIGGNMLDNPNIIQTEEQLTAVIHLTIPRAEIQNVMGAAIAEVMSSIAAQGIAPIGPCFSYHLKIPSDIFDFEVGFPVNTSIRPIGRVKASKLPAAKIACTIYHGGYEGLGAAWGEFCAWIETEGLSAQDCLWESYTSGPESSPDTAKWTTTLNRPLSS